MSWIDRIENDLVIITGDGKKYKPSWINAKKEKEYNIAEFNFPEIKGGLVKRSMPKARRFGLEIYFQGADHIEQADDFDASADDVRAWTLQHPYYGQVTVQPTGLSQDNVDYNTSRILCTVIETIVEVNPKTTLDPLDQIKVKKEVLDGSFEEALTQTPTVNDINTLTTVTNKNYNLSVPIIELDDEFEGYYNAFNQAASAINTATASPLLAMRAIIAVITYPSKFTASVKTRLNLLANQFQNLKNTVAGILNTNQNVSSKEFYQNQAGTVISSMCLAAATPLPGNYTNSAAALEIIDMIIDNYNSFIEDLDTLQTVNGGQPLSFIPNSEPLIQLNNLVNLTVSSLLGIALSSRKERTLFVEKDTNIYLLTHRLYGLDEADKNMEELMENNSDVFGLNEMFLIKKGTKIVYYI